MYFRPETPVICDSAPIEDRAATLEDDMHTILFRGSSIKSVSQAPLPGETDTTPLTSRLSSSEASIPKYEAYSQPSPGCRRFGYPAGRHAETSTIPVNRRNLFIGEVFSGVYV
jgi:hypothetical protein